jgi:hypothetical protein
MTRLPGSTRPLARSARGWQWVRASRSARDALGCRTFVMLGDGSCEGMVWESVNVAAR